MPIKTCSQRRSVVYSRTPEADLSQGEILRITLNNGVTELFPVAIAGTPGERVTEPGLSEPAQHMCNHRICPPVTNVHQDKFAGK